MTPKPCPLGEAQPWRFADFEIGREIGWTEMVIDHAFLQHWAVLFGPAEASDQMPMAAVPLLLMRAFTEVVTPRPAGNVHVNQQCELQRLPLVGDPIRARVSCADKQLRSERRVVTFAVQLGSGREDAPLLSGRTTIFWAA